MADIYDPDAVEGEDNTQEEQKQYEIFKEQIVVLIDAGENMLGTYTEGDEKVTYLQAAVRATAGIMRQRIRHKTNDEVALLFYGVAQGNQDAKGFTNVRLHVPLDVPDAETIFRLEHFTMEDYQEQVGAATGSDAAEDLRFGLWAARDQVISRNTRATKHVLLFSNNQDPLEGSDPATASHRRDALLVRAQDLGNTGMFLDVFPLAVAMGEAFDWGLFWSGLRAEVQGSAEGSVEGSEDADDIQEGSESNIIKSKDALSRLEELLNRRTTRKRPLASLRLTLAPGVDVAVQLFGLVVPASKWYAQMVSKQAYEPVKATTGYFNTATANLVSAAGTTTKAWAPKDAKTPRFPQVLLTTDEVKLLKGVRPRGLTLLGVKPLSWLRPWYQVAHTYFVYPKEQGGKGAAGSTAAFVALQASCLQRELCAVVRYVSREGVPPVLGVLLPQQEVVDDEGVQVTPPGMHLLLLPYQEDVRWQEVTPGVLGDMRHPPRATSAQVAAAEALVGALTLEEEEWDLSALRNPAIAKQIALIEAAALQQDEDPDTPDDTLDAFDPVAQEGAAAEVWAAFKEACYAGVVPKAAKQAPKRKVAPEVAPGDEYETTNWRHLAESDTLLKKLTIDKLKVYLRYHALPLSGVKAELVQRVREHVLDG